MMPMRLIILAVLMALLGACNEQPSSAPPRKADEVRLARGQALFQQHCSACHGASAQGAEEWRRRNPDGTFPPPPLNGTGHAWHHPLADLQRTIRHGTAMSGGNMPAWQGVLTEQDIADVILWFQSLWPDEVYAAWWEIDQRARRGR